MITTTKLIEEGVIWNTVKNLTPVALMAGGGAALGLSRIVTAGSDETASTTPSSINIEPGKDGNYHYQNFKYPGTETPVSWLNNSTVSGDTVRNMTLGGMTALGAGGVMSAMNNASNQTKRVIEQNRQIKANNMQSPVQRPQQPQQPQQIQVNSQKQ